MTDPSTLTQHDSDSRNQPETLSINAEGSNHPIASNEGSILASLEASCRYRILGELGRGGMGVVYQATDNFLSREIAIKVLRDTGSVYGIINRFVDEAVVTSQLQHPGIPAIYDLGFVDGHPYLAMKLIKGVTLTKKLKSIPTPPDRGELIAVFELVCQAVAYAHERHIIHRDLKPSNIMIGDFGEVLVMDWGLAKKLVPKSVAALPQIPNDLGTPTDIRTTRGIDGDGTAPGSVLGTPAFTPPEQASGEIERMDERVDVFGLGAVLCTILTGEPPYIAETGEVVRVMAIRGELEAAFVRLDRCGADPELVALCRQCLARDPSHRLRNAKVVADAVAAYRTGVEIRLMAAEQAVVVAAAQATEQRKRRRVQLALAASLVLLVAGVSGSVWWNQKQYAARLAEAETKANVALNKAEMLAKQASAMETEAGVVLRQEALAAAVQAEGIAAATQDPDLISRIEVRVEAVRMGLIQAERDHLLLTALEKAHGMSADIHRENKRDTRAASSYQKAFEDAGLPTAGDPQALADAIKAEHSRVQAAILTSLDHWAWCLGSDSNAARIWKAADLADGDSFRREVRSAIGTKDKAALLVLAGRPESSNLRPVTATLLARALADCLEHQAAAQVLLATRDQNPGDYWLLIELAHALWELPSESKPGRDEAITCYRAALAARPGSAKAHARLGYCFDQMGDLKEAEKHYQRATERDPTLAEAWNNLGLIQFRRNDLIGAEKSYSTAIDRDPDYARAYTNLGFLLLQKKQFARAEEVLQNGIARDASYHKAYLNLGKVREERGNILGAIAAYQLAVDYGSQDPLAHSNRGESRRWLADWTGAEASFRTALELEPGRILARKNLGWLLFIRGELTEAETCFREVLKSDQKDADSLGKLGWILERKGKLEAAQECYIQAAKMDPDGDNDHSFQAKRLSSRPTTRDMLKQILEDTLAEHPKWSPQQRREIRSTAAISAIWYSRSDAPGIAPSERQKFRQFAHDLFVGVLDELSKSLATSPETTADEMISSTADWLGDVELARVRNLFSLISLPTADAEKWMAVWNRVHAIREKCLKPPRQ